MEVDTLLILLGAIRMAMAKIEHEECGLRAFACCSTTRWGSRAPWDGTGHPVPERMCPKQIPPQGQEKA